MKRIRFSLIVVTLFPVLLICIQGRWMVEAVTEAESTVLTQVVVPQSQLPLEDERHYAEDVMQYAISVGLFSTKLSKWGEECLFASADGGDWRLWAKFPTNHYPHYPVQSDGRSVIISLHHLII